MKTTPGLNYKDELQLGIDELQWLQEALRALRADSMRVFHRPPGLVLPVAGSLPGDHWRVHDSDDDGTVTIVDADSVLAPARAVLVDSDGNIVEYDVRFPDQASTLALTDDATWKTLVATVTTTDIERGTLAVTTGSTTVTGTNTAFTRLSGYTTDGYSRGSRIRIAGSSNGNDGTYEVDTVVSDTELTLRTAVAGTDESSLQWTVAGDFEVTAPADPDIHVRLKVEFSVVTRTRVPSAGQIILADVKRDDGGSPKVSVIDRRQGSDLRPLYVEHRPLVLLPVTTFSTDAVDSLQREEVQADTATAASNPVITTATSGLLAVWVDQDTTPDTIYARRYNVIDRAWAAAVAVDTDNGKRPKAAIDLPNDTHLILTVDSSGKVHQYTGTSNAGTWSSAVEIWDPSNADANDVVVELDVEILRNHRIVLAAQYLDDSVHSSNHVIAYIYSDDYGATWQTNSDRGWDIMTSAGALNFTKPSIVQAGDGRIWTAASTGTLVYARVSSGEALPDPADTTVGGTVNTSSGTIGRVRLIASGSSVAALYESGSDERIHYTNVQSIAGVSGANLYPSGATRDLLELSASSLSDWSACQTPWGSVALVWVNAAPTPDEVQLAEAHVLLGAPTPLWQQIA